MVKGTVPVPQKRNIYMYMYMYMLDLGVRHNVTSVDANNTFFSFHQMLFALFRSVKFENLNIQLVTKLSSISELLFFDLPQRLTMIRIFCHIFLFERLNLQHEIRRRMWHSMQIKL